MKLNHISLLATAVLVISCQEKIAEQDWTAPADGKITLEVTVPDQDGGNILWPDGAMIGFFCDQTENSNTPFELAASTAGTEQAAFYTGIDWAEGLHQMTVYYPYKDKNDGTVLSGNLPMVFQNISGSAAKLGDKNLYYANVQSEPNTAVKVELKPVFSMAEVQISGSSYEGYALDQIAFQAISGKALTGAYDFDLKTAELTFADNASADLVISTAETTITSDGVKAWFLTNDPKSLNEKVEISVSVTKDKKSKLLTGEGLLKNITVIDLNGFSSESVTDDTFDLSDPEGNGEKETANCYVVGVAGKEYKFPATVMGNGVTTQPDDSYTISSGVKGSSPGIVPIPLSPASAKILWQTEPDLIKNVRLKNGYVYFTLNGEAGGQLTEGNAVIAVYDDAASEGKILWSWHIWVTAADLDANLQTWKIHPSLEQYSAYKDPQLMDRNLGALTERGWESISKNTDHGLTYQWGRKDPFVGIDDSAWGSVKLRPTYDSDNKLIGDPIKAGETYSSASKWTYGDKQLTKESIGDSPMRYYYTATNKSNQFWLNEICHDLWGCPGYADDSNKIGSKTIYDPCPRGYRVMNAYAMSGAKPSSPVGGDLIKTGDGEPNIPNAANYSATKSALQVKYDGTNISYIPLTGLYAFDGKSFAPIFRTGSYGYLWTSKMTSGWSCKAYRVHIDVNHFHVGGPKGNGYVSYGHAVRCEKIK